MEKRPSFRLSYRLFVTFLPKKQHLSLAKYFNSPSVCDENKSPRPSALQTKTSGNFPLENGLRPLCEGVRQLPVY